MHVPIDSYTLLPGLLDSRAAMSNSYPNALCSEIFILMYKTKNAKHGHHVLQTDINMFDR